MRGVNHYCRKTQTGDGFEVLAGGAVAGTLNPSPSNVDRDGENMMFR